MSDKNLTKKDLEYKIDDLNNKLEFQNNKNRILDDQRDAYYKENLDLYFERGQLNATIDSHALALEDLKDINISLNDSIDNLESINGELSRMLNMRLAQLNFIMRVVQAIHAYGGDDRTVVHNLAEVLLTGSEEIEVPLGV